MLGRILLGCVLLTSPLAAAVIIGFSPPTQSAVAGGSAAVDVVISGLGDPLPAATSPSLGAFDLTINFDSNLLAVSSVVFGNQLDLFGFGLNPIVSQPLAAGQYEIGEVSLDTVADLNSLQADTFVLATLNFSVLNAGTSPLSISIGSLADAEGADLAASTLAGSITAVPEPVTIWLFPLVFAGASLVGRAARSAGVPLDPQ